MGVDFAVGVDVGVGAYSTTSSFTASKIYPYPLVNLSNVSERLPEESILNFIT